MRAYVINLARSVDRRAHMLDQLAGARLDYTLIEAVDGATLEFSDPRTAAAVGRAVLDTKSLRPAQIANSLSHLRAYQTMLADGQDFAIILEDDVVLEHGIVSLADAIAARMTGAEVALLHFDSPTPCRFTHHGSVSLQFSRKLMVPVDVAQPVSAAAYVISRKAGERMVEQLLPVRARIDDWAFRVHEGMLERVRCVVPVPVTKSPYFESTIDRYPAWSLIPHARRLLLHCAPETSRSMLARRRLRIWRKWARVEFVDNPQTLDEADEILRQSGVVD